MEKEFEEIKEPVAQGTAKPAPVKVKIKPLSKAFIMPEKASEGSAAYDAFVPEDYQLKYGRQILPLGFATEFLDTIACNSRTRAGYAGKGLRAWLHISDRMWTEIRIEGEVVLGLIDSDYRGEVGAILNIQEPMVQYNDVYLRRGQAIGQLEFVKEASTELVLADNLSETARGGNGFGKHNNE